MERTQGYAEWKYHIYESSAMAANKACISKHKSDYFCNTVIKVALSSHKSFKTVMFHSFKRYLNLNVCLKLSTYFSPIKMHVS